jgi:hypothetical protein
MRQAWVQVRQRLEGNSVPVATDSWYFGLAGSIGQRLSFASGRVEVKSVVVAIEALPNDPVACVIHVGNAYEGLAGLDRRKGIFEDVVYHHLVVSFMVWHARVQAGLRAEGEAGAIVVYGDVGLPEVGFRLGELFDLARDGHCRACEYAQSEADGLDRIGRQTP